MGYCRGSIFGAAPESKEFNWHNFSTASSSIVGKLLEELYGRRRGMTEMAAKAERAVLPPKC